MNLRTRLTIACLLLVANGPAFATTYVVDNQNPRAADINAGTQALPFKTVNAAAQKAVAGDEVLVRPGTYREAVTLNNSGAPGKPIIFRSEVPQAAIISGADVVTEWKNEGAGVWSLDAPRLAKLENTDFGNSEWIYINGFPLERADNREQLVPGSFLHDFANKRVWVMPEEGADIKALNVEYANREGLFWAPKSLDDIQINGFTLTKNSSWFRGKSAVGISGSRWIVENNHVLWSAYTGIGMTRTADCVVRNNLIEWSGDAALGGGRNNRMLIDGNKLLHNNWRRINPDFEGGSSKWSSTFNSRIQNNETAYNFGYGLWTDGNNSGNIFAGNLCHDDLYGASLFTEISYGDIFVDNITYNNETGITIGESPNTLVRNNIVFNNNTGIRMRGNYRRFDPDTYEGLLASMKTIPGFTQTDLDQAMARYLILWRAPYYHPSNNSYVEGNLIFDNSTNYFEHRNYAVPSAIDPFINNFSNYNIYYNAKPENNIRHSAGSYADFATWQKVSGRDKDSIFADPRDPQTPIPDWAKAKRAIWDKKYRSPSEMAALNLGTINSPSSAELKARIRSAATVTPLKLSDGQVKAFQFDVGGQPVVAVWTSQLGERRYVRLNTDAAKVTVENGYGGKAERKLDNGIVEVVATYLPTYLHGVGKSVREVPGSTLSARSFNGSGQAVPLKAVFINDAATSRALSASFSANQGYNANPAKVTRNLKAGERVEVPILLVPQGAFVGTARVAMDASLGTDRILRSATFAVGEGAAKLATAKTAPIIDGKLNDWNALGESAMLGSIASETQITGGDKANWGGVADMGAKVYSTWTKDAIYAAVEVTDDVIVPTSPGSNSYENDAVEFFLDGRASDMQWQTQPSEGVYQIAIGPGADGKPVVQVLAKSPLQGLQSAVTRTEKGYIVEMKIPLTAQNFPALDWNAGRAVRVSVLVNDRDSTDANIRNTVLGWNASPKGANYKDTSGWKTLVLQ